MHSLNRGAMRRGSIPGSGSRTSSLSPQGPWSGVGGLFSQPTDGRVHRGPGVHLLVGGVAVTDHLSQDPLLIPIHGLDPGSHLVSRFGHVVPRGRNGPTEGRGPEDGLRG